MEHGKNLDPPFPGEEAAAELIDALTSAQKPMGWGIAQSDDDFRVHKSNLGRKPLPACGHFFLCGNTVPRRPAFHHIRDVYLFSRNPYTFENFREKLAGWTDKGAPRLIFDLSRGFADEHEVGRSAAFPENYLAPGLRERTTLTGKNTLT